MLFLTAPLFARSPVFPASLIPFAAPSPAPRLIATKVVFASTVIARWLSSLVIDRSAVVRRAAMRGAGPFVAKVQVAGSPRCKSVCRLRPRHGDQCEFQLLRVRKQPSNDQSGRKLNVHISLCHSEPDGPPTAQFRTFRHALS